MFSADPLCWQRNISCEGVRLNKWCPHRPLMASIVFKWNVLNVCFGGEGFERIFIVFSFVLCGKDRDRWLCGYEMIRRKFDRAMRWGVIKIWGGSWGRQCSAFLSVARLCNKTLVMTGAVLKRRCLGSFMTRARFTKLYEQLPREVTSVVSNFEARLSFKHFYGVNDIFIVTEWKKHV